VNAVEQDLRMLRENWEDAYAFYWHDGKFWAERTDDHTAFPADTADELRDLVTADYIARPVPREVSP
jgi:hypothetical protein